MNNNMNILKLPTELLVEILMFCDTLAVANFAKAVQQKKTDIWDVIANGKLWKYVLIPPINDYSRIIKYLERFGTKIKHLKICSFAEKVNSKDESLAERKKLKITASFMLNIQFTCTALERLTIANCAINSDEIKLSMFPKTISNF